MADSKILTRFEIYDELYNSIPENIMNMDPPCRYDTFVDCIYNDEDYDENRCASKIETSMDMNDFMTQFLGNTLSTYCCAEWPSNWTWEVASNQLVPTDKFNSPMGKFSGGKIDNIYYVTNGSLSFSLDSGISMDWIMYFDISGKRRDLMSGYIPDYMIGGTEAYYTNSFITDNNGYIGIEINFSNITSHNITKLNIVKSYGYSPEVLLTLSKSNTTTNSVTFEAYSSKAVMDYILDNGLKLEIAGNVVGTEDPDIPYTFNLKSASSYIPEAGLNLTNTLYSVPSSRVRLAYSTNQIADNQIVLYTNDFTKKFSTTDATLSSNFVLTIKRGIHSVAKNAINSNQYFFLKVPIEYDYSGYGNYKRVVLYYPLIANSSSSSQKITITTAGPVLVGMCNYHTSTGWFWNCEYNHTNSITKIYLPNQQTNMGDTIQDATVSSTSGQSTRETDFPCTHLLFFQSTSGNRTLNIHDGEDGTTSQKIFGTTARICIIPSTISDFNQLVDMLNRNESENISYSIE